MRKYKIAKMFGKRYGYSTYLEICTPTTGLVYGKVDKQQFTRQVRIMYCRPPEFSDGEPIDFSTESENAEALYQTLIQSGERFDVVFVDPRHTYAASLRDLVFALQLVKPDGMVLVHDCFPPDENFASPEYQHGNWCGLTFAAYLDIVLFNSEVQYFTINSDYGCGVIYKAGQFSQFPNAARNKELLQKWQQTALPDKYAFFAQHHQELLNLIAPDEFRKLLFNNKSKLKSVFARFKKEVMKKAQVELYSYRA